jgi:transposase
MKQITTLGIDLAKKSFQLHGVDDKARAVLRKKLNRKELPIFMANLPPCLVLMEACATAHYWGRKFQKMGHEVKLIAAQFVKPFVKSQKNDRNDAEAIVDCGLRPSMRFVSVKAPWQQDIQILHRARRRAVNARTAIINQVKGLLMEYGVIIEERDGLFKSAALAAIEDAENELTKAIRQVITENLHEYDFLVGQIKIFENELKNVADTSDDCQRLLTVPGVGLLGATAFVASIGDPGMFKNGRQVGSWLGLVPKQHSTGGVARLLSITKKGDPELRAILIHGARANLLSMKRKKKPDELSKWALGLLDKKGWGKTSVAMANKMARMMWHILKYKEEYQMI